MQMELPISQTNTRSQGIETIESPAPVIRERKYQDHWSDDGQIFFTGGVGYGLTKNLRTVQVGKEEDISKSISSSHSFTKATATKPLRRNRGASGG